MPTAKILNDCDERREAYKEEERGFVGSGYKRRKHARVSISIRATRGKSVFVR